MMTPLLYLLVRFANTNCAIHLPDSHACFIRQRRDPLKETMADLGLDDSSLGRFGARSFGTQEDRVAV